MSRIVVALVALLLLAAIALGAAGDLDPSFDGDGRRVIDLGGTDLARAVTIQPDGRILLAGQGSGNGVEIVRLRSDGSLDASFGAGDGETTVTGDGFAGPANAIGREPDGRIVVAGGAGSDAGVARVLPNGAPDSSFDGDGRRVIDLGGGGDVAYALALQPDGKVLIAGKGFEDGFALARLLSDGSPDAGFGGGGMVAVSFGDDVRAPAYAVALQRDGRIVVAGDYGFFSNAIALARLLPDGSLDTSFGDGGRQVVDSREVSHLHAMAIAPDGRIVLASSGGQKAFGAIRLLADGALDASFAGDGIANFGLDNTGGSAEALALQPDGKIVLAGYTSTNAAIVRLQPNGSLDSTFSGDGMTLVDFFPESGGSARAHGVALASDGDVVLAGAVGAGVVSDVAVARLQGDPPPPGAAGTPGSPGPGAGAGAGAGAPGGTGSPPRCGGKRATIIGTARSDVLRGTRGRDVIVGLAGNDTISGLGGKDIICGGAGKDRLKGGAGADLLLGGAGPDILAGGAGLDVLRGGAGKDRQLQ